MKNIVVGLLAHVDAGKTTLAESLMYQAGHLKKLGRVDHKTAFLDFDNQERDRGITIFSKQAIFDYENTNITLIDTPGHIDFSLEMERSLSILDYAILVINGTKGVESHTKTVWKLLNHYHVPTFIFVNKMDISYLSKGQILKDLQDNLSEHVVDFSDNDDKLYENIALCSENLLEQYLETGEVLDENIKELFNEMKMYPCLFGSALKNQGIDKLLNLINVYTHEIIHNDEFKARTFKVSHEEGIRLVHLKVLSGHLRVKTELKEHEKVDQIRLYSGNKYETTQILTAGEVGAIKGLKTIMAGEELPLNEGDNHLKLQPFMRYQMTFNDNEDLNVVDKCLSELQEEDPGLGIQYIKGQRTVNLSLMGEIEVEVLKRRLFEQYHLEVEFGEGHVEFEETIASPVVGVGHYEPLRHYAEVHVLIEPLAPGSGIEFKNIVPEHLLSKPFQATIVNAFNSDDIVGTLTGSKVTDIRITLIAGKGHLKHTVGGDFKEALNRAIRQGLKEAQGIILEPYYEFRLELPNNLLSKAIYDIEQMNGTYNDPTSNEDYAVLTGEAPARYIQQYQKEVNNYSRGLGCLTLSFKNYQVAINQEEILMNINYDSEQDLEHPTGSVFCIHGAGYYVPYYEVKHYAHIEPLDLTIKKPEKVEAHRKYTIDDEEVRRVFEKACPTKKNKEYIPAIKPKVDISNNATVTIKSGLPELYLIDAYNVIYSDNEFKKLASEDLALARMRLLDLVANFSAYKHFKAIVVFDAYKVKGRAVSKHKYDNIEIVFTKENETADAYIEGHLNEYAKNYRVSVVTSDYLEQIVTFSKGARRLVSHTFYLEMVRAFQNNAKDYQSKQIKISNQPLAEISKYLDDEE